ncbi:hypothetical protein [Alloactinosynnema sp. L-07]|nr:hypothetical protein [Alloactinosynnema sp. L-07]
MPSDPAEFPPGATVRQRAIADVVVLVITDDPAVADTIVGSVRPR